MSRVQGLRLRLEPEMRSRSYEDPLRLSDAVEMTKISAALLAFVRVKVVYWIKSAAEGRRAADLNTGHGRIWAQYLIETCEQLRVKDANSETLTLNGIEMHESPTPGSLAYVESALQHPYNAENAQDDFNENENCGN